MSNQDELKKKFFNLSFIKTWKYADISKELNIPKKTLTDWWEEQRKEREALLPIRKLWKKKCSKVDFYVFKHWLETAERKCHYCNLTEKDLMLLWKNEKIMTTRPKRGMVLEIDRIKPKEKYDNLVNLTYSCYWCNNAKSDEFSEEEFLKVGKVIGEIWKERLSKA